MNDENKIEVGTKRAELANALRSAALDLLEFNGAAGACIEITGEPPLYVLIGHASSIGKLLPEAAQPQTDAAAPSFPERDPSKPTEQQGLFRKFEVRRVDGSDQPTDLPKRLRAYAANLGFSHSKIMIEAADEIERYYGGMLAWKRTAEAKDATLAAEAPSVAQAGPMDRQGEPVAYAFADGIERLARVRTERTYPNDSPLLVVHATQKGDYIVPLYTRAAQAMPQVTKDEIHTLRRLIECAETLNKRPRPMCRDCADEDGTCPNSGLECSMLTLFSNAKALHNKLATPDAQAVQADAVRDVPEQAEQIEEDDAQGAAVARSQDAIKAYQWSRKL